MRRWCSCSPAWPSTRCHERLGQSFLKCVASSGIPRIMDGTERPEYGKVVDIVTRDSLRELATPGCSRSSLRSPLVSVSESVHSVRSSLAPSPRVC